MRPQTTDSVFMIRPKHFGFNEQTAKSNSFQNANTKLAPRQINDLAVLEFDTLVSKLKKAEITVHVFDDLNDERITDSIFPNNWVFLSHDGTVYLFLMEAEHRRLEIRLDIVMRLQNNAGYICSPIIDQSSPDPKNLEFLESTGSMVMDHKNNTIYASLSSRTHIWPLKQFAKMEKYKLITFDSFDKDEQIIYHTNVMMSVGDGLAVVCLSSIKDTEKRRMVKHSLENTGHHIIDISLEQMHAYAGNVMNLKSNKGQSKWVMSKSAFEAFTKGQIQTIEKYGNIVYSPIPTIEQIGGGSVRCMIAEIFLPKKNIG